jgi:hypothetical protein
MVYVYFIVYSAPLLTKQVLFLLVTFSVFVHKPERDQQNLAEGLCLTIQGQAIT